MKTVEIGNCDIHADRKMLFINEIKRHKNLAKTERLSSKNISNFNACLQRPYF
jgi:hypothetical protein